MSQVGKEIELRKLRRRCQEELDALWQSDEMTKEETLIYLQGVMNLEEDEAVIERFTKRQCQEFLARINKAPEPVIESSTQEVSQEGFVRTRDEHEEAVREAFAR